MERNNERFGRSASRERLLSRLFSVPGVATSSSNQQQRQRFHQHQQQPQSRTSADAAGSTAPNLSTFATIGVRLGAIEDHHRCMTTEIQ